MMKYEIKGTFEKGTDLNPPRLLEIVIIDVPKHLSYVLQRDSQKQAYSILYLLLFPLKKFLLSNSRKVCLGYSLVSDLSPGSLELCLKLSISLPTRECGWRGGVGHQAHPTPGNFKEMTKLSKRNSHFGK